jgi:hypothetical protein
MAEAKAGRTSRREKIGRNMVMMGPLHASGRSRKVERVKGIEPSLRTYREILGDFWGFTEIEGCGGR